MWLNLAQLPDKEKVPLLNSPVTAIGLSGVAVGAMREKFQVAQKGFAVLRNPMP